MQLTAAQLRAARGLLDWTRADLAKAAQLSPETIKNIEHGSFKPQDATCVAIERAFALHDVEFTDNEGVRRRRDFVKTFVGIEGFKLFFDELYEVVKSTGEEICTLGVDESLFIKHLGAYADVHIKRMTEIKAPVRCIICEGDHDVYCDGYNEYRCMAVENFSSVPFYIYNNHFAVVIFENDSVSVVQVESTPVCEAYRKQFEIMWKRANPLPKN